MPTIPNFPEDLLATHHKWHDATEHPELPPLRVHPPGSKGSGLEFLTFHRDFTGQVMAWYDTTHFSTPPFDNPSVKASLVTPWTSVPAEIRALSAWDVWKADAARLDSAAVPGPTRPSDFDSADDLGIFIETGIHNRFLHGAAADVFGEEIVRSLHSPQSTLFYKIHGLVQHWWSLWARRYALRGSPSTALDPNRPVPRHSPVFGEPSTTLDPNRAVPRVSAQPSEVPFDPREMESLTARVRRLEDLAFPMSMSTAEHELAVEPQAMAGEIRANGKTRAAAHPPRTSHGG